MILQQEIKILMIGNQILLLKSHLAGDIPARNRLLRIRQISIEMAAI